MSPLGAWNALGALLGDADLLKAVRDGLNSEPRTGETLAVVAGAAALIGLIAVGARHLNPEGRRKVRRQVDVLSRAGELLGLTVQERADLRRIAERASLSEPGSMLLSPANLAHAAARAALRVRDQELQRSLDAVCLKLFDVPLPHVGSDRAEQP